MSVPAWVSAPVKAALDQGASAEPQLRAYLIRLCNLDDKAVTTITRLQRAKSIGFGEAAIHLGLVTAADVEGARLTAAPARRALEASPVERLILAHSPYHPRSEELRTLRTELLLRHEDVNEANIVAVLSPCAAEGRSQLAAELAISFAQLGQPTLLVDADLRHPQQHVLFNADNTQGLSQALARDQAPHLQSVAKLPELSLLTAGPLPSNPLELLSDRRFEALVRDWREHFHFVVLDTPPVGRFADGLAVATIIGRVLSLSRAKHTPYKDTRNMMRRLAATRSRVLGAVINRF